MCSDRILGLLMGQYSSYPERSRSNDSASYLLNNSAQFSPCSLLVAFLLVEAPNPCKRIGQTHLSSQGHPTALSCQRNPARFSRAEFRSRGRANSRTACSSTARWRPQSIPAERSRSEDTRAYTVTSARERRRCEE